MFRRLVADGLVDHADDRELQLTSAGRAAADAIFRRHALLEWLLTSVIGLGWAESDDEAMRLQGAISPRVEARLDELLGHPETCPHGNPDRRRDRESAARGRPPVRDRGRRARDGLPHHRGSRGGRRPALVPRGPRAQARGADHDPGPLRIARFADPRRPARARDARPPTGRPRPRPPGRRRSGPVPPRAGRSDPHGLRRGAAATIGRCPTPSPSPHRPEPDRPAPHRHRAHGAVQLPVRPARRRHVHPPPRGHRRRAQHARVREGHPRRAALAGPGLGRGARRSPASRPAARTRPYRQMERLPRYAEAAAAPARRRPAPTPATARPRSSTPTARPRRRPSSRRATSGGART